MKKYIAPEMEVANFNLSDVLTTSGSDAHITSEGAYNGVLAADNGVTFVY